MKKLLIFLGMLACSICLFIPLKSVYATDYSYTNGGNKSYYDISVMSKGLVENIIYSECGTLENIYYVARASFKDNGEMDCIRIYFVMNIEEKNFIGKFGYVLNDDYGMYDKYFTDYTFDRMGYYNYWDQMSIEKDYISRYIGNSSQFYNGYYGNYVSDTITERTFCTNIPVFKTKAGLDSYFETGSTADLVVPEGQYSPEAPYVTNVYLSYTARGHNTVIIPSDQENVQGVTDVEVNLFYTVPEGAEGYTAKIYYRADTRIYKLNNVFTGKYKHVDYKTTMLSSPDRNFGGSNFVPYEVLVDKEKIEEQVKASSVFREIDSINALGHYVCVVGYTFYIQLDNGEQKGDVVSVDCNVLKLGMNTNVNNVTPVVNPTDVNRYDGSNKIDDIADGKIDPDETYHVDGYAPQDDIDKQFNSIVDTIKSGFGLLGDDGLLAMISKTFGFIPPAVIGILIATFSTVCVVIVVKFVRG